MATKKATKNTGIESQSSISQLNETGRRDQEDRRQKNTEVSGERRKVKRRRQIDPTTCEREYNASEIEFMQAMDDYKRASGRMFPTCSEILEVIIHLGYRQIAEHGQNYQAELDSDMSQANAAIIEEVA